MALLVHTPCTMIILLFVDLVILVAPAKLMLSTLRVCTSDDQLGEECTYGAGECKWQAVDTKCLRFDVESVWGSQWNVRLNCRFWNLNLLFSFSSLAAMPNKSEQQCLLLEGSEYESTPKMEELGKTPASEVSG